MPFPASYQDNESYYNNADSFAMAFDDAWKEFSARGMHSAVNTEEKLRLILSEIENHPFLKNNSKQAEDIIRFRLRLLNLE